MFDRDPTPRHHHQASPASRDRTLQTRHSTTQRVVLGAAALGLAGLIGLHAGHSGQTAPSVAQTSPNPLNPSQTAASIAPVVTGNLTVALIAPEDAQAALQASALPPADQTRLLQAVRNGETELARMPIFDANGATGHRVTVTADGITQNITLTPQVQMLVLPVAATMRVAIAAVSSPGPTGTRVGLASPEGTAALPPFLRTGDNAIITMVLQ